MSSRINSYHGNYVRGQYQPFDANNVMEEVKYSWFNDDTGGLKREAVISPEQEKGAYSWLSTSL